MSDDIARPNSIDARLAVLEATVRALSGRLDTVSGRTHTLISEVQVLTLAAEEARDQRGSLIDKLNDVQTTINSLNTASVKSVIEMTHHVRLCELRSARLERLAWAVVSVLVAVLGFLVAPYFVRPH